MALNPDDPTKAQAWVRGAGTPDIKIDLYVPRGNKGDPGGLVPGTALTADNDLNEVTAAGIYFAGLNIASPIKNYPGPGTHGGTLIVYERGPSNTANNGYQEYWPTSSANFGAVFYRRTKVNGAWAAWRAFAAQRVDQSAGRAIYTWDDVNSREQLVYGDTGIRDITLTRDTAISSGGVHTISRKGHMVTLSLFAANVLASGSGAVALMSLPVGFRPQTSQRGVMQTASGTDTKLLEVTAAGAINIWNPSIATYSGSISFPTNEAWPAVLPGSSVGPIPSA